MEWSVKIYFEILRQVEKQNRDISVCAHQNNYTFVPDTKVKNIFLVYFKMLEM